MTGTSELSMRVGQRVRAVRAARAMTMKQLATESGISLPYLSRVEKGDGNISIAVLHKLSVALSLDTDALLADTDRYGGDYAIIQELLKRQSADELRQIRQWLVQHITQTRGGENTAGRIALVGLRGAGKSTVGPVLARRLGTPFIELNAEIEKEAGLTLNEIFSVYGQAGYRHLERRCLDRIVANYPALVLATGGGIVVEPATYELLLHSFYNVWMYARPEEHFRRVMAQHDSRIATTELQHEAMANIVSMINAREKLYALAQASIDTTDLSAESVVDQIMQLMAPSTSTSGSSFPATAA